MVIPSDLVDIIIYYIDDLELVIPFLPRITKQTIRYLLRKTNIEKQIRLDNVELVQLMLNMEYEVNWLVASVYNISERMIDLFHDKLSWFYISEQPMSEAFMRKYVNKLNWKKISKYQKLSREFISDFADKLEWNYISEYQNITEDILYKFKDRLNLAVIYRRGLNDIDCENVIFGDVNIEAF